MTPVGRRVFLFARFLVAMLLAGGVGHESDGEEASERTGSVAGVITFRGETPLARTPDGEGRRGPLLTIDRKTDGLADVVVHLVLNKNAEQAVDAAPVADVPPVIDQREHLFTPRLLAVASGQTVRFTNSDPANHNVRASSFDERNAFNIFTGVGGEHRHRFFSDGKDRPVVLSCDIHPWMRGWIFVFEHPHFAVSDARGAFTIADVPPGEHRLVLRQPDIGYRTEHQVVVRAEETARTAVEIDGAELD